MIKIKNKLGINSFSFYELLLKPNNNKLIEFFRYVFVGIIATAVDCIVLFFAELVIENLVICVAIGLIAGFFVTFIGTRKLVFYTPKKVSRSEFVGIFLITILGMLLTEILINFFTYKIEIYFMISKIIVTIIIMLYNFIVKKIFYKYYNNLELKGDN